MAVIGDSIESGGTRPAEAWPALVAVDRRWKLENYSVPGAGFVAHGGDGQDFGAQVDQAIALPADMVLIGASDNDLGRDICIVSAAMTAAVERLRTALPHARILGFNALTGEASDDDLAPLNEALRDAVTAVGGHWLDLGQPYRGQAGLVQNDGEHPTPAGQQAIAAAVLERLDDRASSGPPCVAGVALALAGCAAAYTSSSAAASRWLAGSTRRHGAGPAATRHRDMRAR